MEFFNHIHCTPCGARNSAAEKSESESEGGQKFLPPNPLPPHQNKFGTGLRFLPARIARFAGEPMIFYYNIKSAQFSKELSLKSLLVFSKQTQRPR